MTEKFKVISVLIHKGKVVRTEDESLGGRVSTEFKNEGTTFFNNIEFETRLAKIETDPDRNAVRVYMHTTWKTGIELINGRRTRTNEGGRIE